MQTATVFMSKYPGEPHFIPLPPPGPDLVSIHHHALERGRFLVIEWTWDAAGQDWRQTGLVNAPSLENAREYVPPGAELRAVPEEFGLEAWVVS
jgi:hypothetical protein